jgi:hypothetical protein
LDEQQDDLDEQQDDFFPDAEHALEDDFSFLSQSASSFEHPLEHSQVSQAFAFA